MMGGMDNGKPIPAGIWVLYTSMLGAYLVPLMSRVPVIGILVGSAAGAFFILCIVRWANRRDGRRPTNRSEDAP